MKKAGLFVFVAVLILSVSIISSFVHAQSEIEALQNDSLIRTVQGGQQQYEQYTSAENKSEYLKTEWNKILLKHKYIGPVMSTVNYVFDALNPFFKIVLGIEYSISWAFIFAVAIWLMLFFLLNPIAAQMFNSGILGGVAAFAMASLVGIAGVIRGAVNILTTMINNVWIAWIAFILAIFLVLLAEIFGKKIKAKMKKSKEESEKEKTAQAQKIIQVQGKVAEKELKSQGDTGEA